MRPGDHDLIYSNSYALPGTYALSLVGRQGGETSKDTAAGDQGCNEGLRRFALIYFSSEYFGRSFETGPAPEYPEMYGEICETVSMMSSWSTG